MRFNWSDIETYSEKPINHGTFAYAAEAEIMLWAYASGDGAVKVWDRTVTTEMPKDLEADLNDPDCVFFFHNSMFDRTVIGYSLDIWIPLDRVRCTMVQSLAHSLPGKLDTLCTVMGVKEEDKKKERGRDLVMLFCKPRPKNQTTRRATPFTHPNEWMEFVDYAAHDITAMRSIHHKMPMWNYRGDELNLWFLDQRINERGFLVDTKLAEQAIIAVKHAQDDLSREVREKTDEFVQRATQRDKMLKYILEEYGVDLPDMQRATLERRLNDESLPQEVKDLLAIRLEASMNSGSKYSALMRAVSADGRLKGTIQFCGASRTGRDAGRTFQPQNLFRPTLKPEQIEYGIEVLKSGASWWVMDNVIEMAANAVRGCIIAPPGKKICVADLSNIEGRFAAWVAFEEWKLKAFSDYDTITGYTEKNGKRKPVRLGADLYRMAYAKAFAIPVEQVDGGKDSGPHRQIGKVMELMLQYEGGVGAFLTGAATYGIDLDEMAIAAWSSIPDRTKLEALKFYEWTIQQRRTTFGLSRETFIVCDSLKRLWREAHPNIAAIWGQLKDAFVACINNENLTVAVGRVKLCRTGVWLRIQLPSGRYLCYPSPQVDDKGQLSYLGVNNYTRTWQRIKTYGGKIFENIVQAGSRDVFTSSWQPVEDAFYEIVLRVHDELITEAPDNDDFSAAELSRIMSTNPPWAQGLPLAAGGFESYRYRKGD